MKRNPVEPERWKKVEQIYNSALERKPEDRAAYLRDACGDESLRKEVESLLACQSGVKSFIEPPALEAAAQKLALGQSDQASAALAGRTLSRYRISEKLGEGAWASSTRPWIPVCSARFP